MRHAYICAGVLAFSIALQAYAADSSADAPPNHAIELGIGIGQSSLRLSSPDIPGHTTIHATGYKAFAGYRFSKYFAVEAAYLDGGTFTEEADGDRADLHPRIEQLSVIGSYPVLGPIAIFGRVGADHWNAHLVLSDPVLGKATLSGSDTDFAWGAGVEAYIDRALLRVEFEQMQTRQNLDGILPTDFTHRLISLSIVWML